MRRYRSSRYAESSSEGIDISPLIDVVFILLLFFIVTTVFVKKTGVEVDRPKSVPSSKPLDNESITIALTKENEIYYGGRNVGITGVKVIVEQAKAKVQGKPVAVVLDIDELTPGGMIVRVSDAARGAGADSVSLATED